MTIQAEDGRDGRKPSDDVSHGMCDSIRDGFGRGNTPGREADEGPEGRGAGGPRGRRVESRAGSSKDCTDPTR